MKWHVTTPPTGTPVTWQTIKAHLSNPPAEHRTLVEMYLAAATEYAQEAMATSLMPQTITATYYDNEEIILPRGPVYEVESVEDADGELGDDDYEHRRIGHADVLMLDRCTYPVTVVYRAGYASLNPSAQTDAETVPADIRAGIMAHAASMYMVRESVTETPLSVAPHLADFYRLKSRNVGIG